MKEKHFPEGEPPELPTIPEAGDEDTTHNMTLVEEFKCTVCNKEFVSDLSCRSHLLTHDVDEVEAPRQACPEPNCGRKYSNAKSLEYHVKYMHRLKSAHVCPHPDCNKSFGRASSLKRHTIVHDMT